MSKYTTEVRWICEQKSGFTEAELQEKTPDEIIAAARGSIFNFSYPIYNEDHRTDLEIKILKHYYTREIGAETFALWRFWLNTRLNEIMPKYNELYKAEEITFNKGLNNIDVTMESTRTDDLLRTDDFTQTHSDSEQTSNLRTDNLSEQTSNLRTDNLQSQTQSSTKETRKYSDTPQGSVTFNEVNQENYWLSDYTETENTGTVTTTDTGTQNNAGTRTNTGTQSNAGTRSGTGSQTNAGTSANTGTVDTVTREHGYRGSKLYFELMQDYEKNILNIDMMIINELKNLFFKLW